MRYDSPNIIVQNKQFLEKIHHETDLVNRRFIVAHTDGNYLLLR